MEPARVRGIYYGAMPRWCYGRAMFGWVLYALVWLIIAAGLALPLYPGEGPMSTVAASADAVQLAAASVTFGCNDCPAPDGGRAECRDDCACDQALPAAAPLESPVGVTVAVTVRSHPSARLPVKLPAI